MTIYGTGPSDHASFYRKDIPVLFFITGMHKDLHKPTDDVDKINVPGRRRVSEMVLEAIEEIAKSDVRPAFLKVVDEKAPPKGYLGVMPAEESDGQGVTLQEVLKDSRAEKAGFKPGDLVLKIGETKIPQVSDLLKALRNRKPGEKLQVTVQRETEQIVLEVVLGKR